MTSIHLDASSAMPGVGAKPILVKPAADLRLLDDAAEWSAFSQPASTPNGCWTSSVVIEGMHCAACALTIEDALLAVPGVTAVQVSSASGRAKVTWSDRQVHPSQWMQSIRAAGYGVLPANDASATQRRHAETRKALWRWLVAGLCMMQVMMYATPAYVAREGEMTADMMGLLRWASWVLTLPVMLFACGPFFASALRDLRSRQVSMDLPVALGILITFAVSTAGTFEPQGIFGHEVYFDSLTMFVFFLLTGRWLELRLRDRTAGALDGLLNRLPDSVERQSSDGSFERVATRRLAAGDLVRVLPGEVFPGDGVVVSGHTLADEALLTGESRPVSRCAGDLVIAGSHNLDSAVLVRLQKLGDQTRFAQIVSLMESAATSKPNLARLADRLAKPFLLSVLVLSALACLWWWPSDPARALMVAVAVLVVTCPCALSLATPAAMLAAAGAMARQGILVRRLQGLESLAAVDTVVFDKTGTLTRDAGALSAVRHRDSLTPETALQWAASLAAHSLHPVSRALVRALLARAVVGVLPAADVTETAGQGVRGVVDGRHLRLGSARLTGRGMPQDLPADGLRVHLADDDGWLASFVFTEDLREDAALTVKCLQDQGITVRLLSGDVPEAARRVGLLAGIRDVEGGCSPQDKLDRLQALQQAGRRVAMVGDGLNDGPVLAGAHVSFAFGKSVPIAQAQSDFVVLGENLGAVAQTVLLARRTLSVVRQNLWWALAYNLVCVPLAVMGWLPAWLAGLGMATSSLLVVLNALRLAGAMPRMEANNLLESR